MDLNNICRVLAIAALIIASPGGISLASESESGDPARGEKIFKRCKACHAIGERAKHKVGPNLNGILCRPVASAEGYRYGKATKAFGETGAIWTAENLFTYLEKPGAFVGGRSKMTFRLKKADARRDVIAYIGQFQADGTIGEIATCE